LVASLGESASVLADSGTTPELLARILKAQSGQYN
jgi:hypothetical protein